MSDDLALLSEAIRLSRENVERGGGPFGAVIARDGSILARGANAVTAGCDPTAHAEVVAIRAACKALKTFSLEGATLYSSCEPCPMCLAAAYWARLSRIVWAATRDDAAAVGFDDARIYRELALSPEQRSLAMGPDPSARAAACEVLLRWKKTDNLRY